MGTLSRPRRSIRGRRSPVPSAVAPSPVAGALSGIAGVGTVLAAVSSGRAPEPGRDIAWCVAELRRVYVAVRALHVPVV